MKPFKGQKFNDRLAEAAKARQALLESYKARPSESDPEMIKLRQQQKA